MAEAVMNCPVNPHQDGGTTKDNSTRKFEETGEDKENPPTGHERRKSNRKKCSLYAKDAKFDFMLWDSNYGHRCNCSFCVGGFQCVLCDELFSSKTDLKNHLPVHFADYGNCGVCLARDHKNCDDPKVVPATEQLPDTITIVKIPKSSVEVNASLVCDECGKSFENKRLLIRHMKIHQKDTCEVCGKSFIKSDLKIHLRKVHGRGVEEWLSQRPYECEFCKKRLSLKSMKFHVLTHLGEFQCTECPRAYRSRLRLKNHTIQKHETPPQIFNCDTCDRNFGQKSNLKTHIKTHIGEKPYQCKICQKGFYFHYAYLEHMATHEKVKYFHCATCGKGLSTKKSLVKHAMTHRGKNFVCDTCGSKFRYSSSLKRHKKTNCDSKGYSCEYCLKKFKQRRAMKSHMGVHTGKRPYLCGYCEANFTREREVMKHVVKEHMCVETKCQFCAETFLSDEALKHHVRMHLK